MKRSGFTMIELIFVIVILGILAAVAIPKLAATRDDAKISTKVQEATQFVQEMSTYYTAQGTFGKVKNMSNVKLSTDATSESEAGETDMNTTNGKVYLTDGNNVGCVSITAGASDTAVAGSKDGNITIKNLGGASSICRGIEKALKDKNISSTTGVTHTFGGSNVSF